MGANKKHYSNREIDELFDLAAEQIRHQSVDPSVVKGAADRVWAKLSSEGVEATSSAAPIQSSLDERQIRGCDDFQSLIPDYLSGSLSEARNMLFEDHTHECVGCRKALREARYGKEPGIDAYRTAPRFAALSKPVVRWAIAATLVLVAGLVFYERVSRVADAFDTIVYAMDGPVYTVSSTETRSLAINDKVPEGEKVRCAKDAGAVMKLPDGSLIEMRERSEFSVTNGSGGATIHLDRGNIIVQAAKQPRGRRLYVQTGDCLVEVKGTIFSVNSGTKGSRVSVIDGEVQVDHAGQTNLLLPGQQVTTSPALDRVPVNDEVAWSRDRQRYARMLAEAAALRRDVDAGASIPESRYSTRLLDMAPEGTVIYIAIPNITTTLKESQKIIDERLAQNADLRDWWQKEQASGGRREWSQALAKVTEFGEYLGDEIVICAQLNSRGEPDSPVVLATLKDPSGFRTFAERQIAALSLVSKKPTVKFVDNPTAEVQGEKADIYAWVNGDILVGAPKLDSIRQIAANTSTFGSSSFHAKLADIYQEGAGFIIAADLERIIGAQRKPGSKEDSALKQLGILDLKHFILEVKDDQGKPTNRAVLSFNPSEHGIASWLAAPGPMGALRFISPDASVVAAFVVKQPTALVDDLLNAMNTVDPQLQEHLSQFESETGLNIRNDLAAPLGGEFAFAVDGPLLPTPSWKLVFEVYDPAHLQSTIERLVDDLNQQAAREGKGGFQWDNSESGGLTYYTLKSVDLGVEVDYTYTDGYLIACPSRALVDRAVRNEDSGYTLLHSERFVAALPGDKNPNFSALVYHNLGGVLSPLARGVGGAVENLPEDQRAAFKSLTANAPVLAYAYAYGDRITFAMNGENGPVGLNPSDLLGMPGSFGLQSIIGGAMGK